MSSVDERRDVAAVDADAARSSSGVEPDEGLGELGLPVALHAGDRVDLAAAHGERDVVDQHDARVVDDA